MRKTSRLYLVTALTAAFALVLSGFALADDATNSAHSNNNNGVVSMTSGGNTSVSYWIDSESASQENTGGNTGGTNGCNADIDNPITVTVSAPAQVTTTSTGFAAATKTLSFSTCGSNNSQSVTFGSSTPGAHSISHTVSGGRGNNDNEANFTLNVKPGAPGPLNASAGDQTVTVNWTLSSDDTKIDGYKVFQVVPGNGDQVASVDPGVTTTTLTDLTNDQQYCYEVRAFKGAVLSDAAERRCATPEAPTVTNAAPSTPGTPALKAGSASPNAGAFTLQWAASTDSDGDAITYTLERMDADDTTWSQVDTGISTNEYAFTTHPGNTWTFRVQASDGTASSAFSDASNAVVVDRTNPNAPTSVTNPSTAAYNDGTNDWWQDTVTVTWSGDGDPSLADGSAGTGVASLTNASDTFTTTGSHTSSSKAVDGVGNESTEASRTVHVDADDPTVAFDTGACPSSVTLGSTRTAAFSAGDGTGQSGLNRVSDGTSDVSSPVTLDTSSVGAKSLTLTAYDNVGNTGQTVCNYEVHYAFTGFFAPVDNLPTRNTVKAGRSIPVKFKLGGDMGLAIFGGSGADYPNASQPVSWNLSCTPTGTDAIETTTAGNSMLQYDALTQTYTYVWKTDAAWAGKCRVFELNLNDGSSHQFSISLLK